jgi:hypothetical protein
VSGGEVAKATHLRRALIFRAIVEEPRITVPSLSKRSGLTQATLRSELYRMGVTIEDVRALEVSLRNRRCPRCGGTGLLRRDRS